MIEYEVLSEIVKDQFNSGQFRSKFFSKDDLINDLYLTIATSEAEMSEQEIKELVKKKYFSYFDIYDIKDEKSYDKFTDNSRGVVGKEITQLKDKTFEFFESIIWKDGCKCVKCNSKEVYPSETSERYYSCRQCGHNFSFSQGTNLSGTSKTKLKNLKTVYKLMNRGVICKRGIQDSTKLSKDIIKNSYLQSLPAVINKQDLVRKILKRSENKSAEYFKDTPLYVHQIKAVSKAVEYFKENNRGQIIHPCGSGKTRTTVEIIKSLNCDKIAIVCPSVTLLNQHVKVFEKYFPEYVLQVIHSKNKGTVKNQIQEVKNTENEKLIIFTTIRCFSSNHQILGESFLDICVFDEAHKIAGGNWKQTIRCLESNSYKKALFLTATRKLTLEEFTIGMDHELFGNVIDNYSINNAIEDNIVLDYKILCVEENRDLLTKYLSEIDSAYLDRTLKVPIKKRVITSVLSLFKVLKEKGIKKIISYHATVEESVFFSEVVKYLQNDFKINLECFNIHSEMKYSLLKEEISNFEESKFSIISSVNCFQEGMDVKDVDAVLFGYPKRSKIAIVQSVGRCVRKDRNKKVGYVIVPYSNEDYSGLIDVVNSLKEVDNRWILSDPRWDFKPSMLEFHYDNSTPSLINTAFVYKNLRIGKGDFKYLSYQECSKLSCEMKIGNIRDYSSQRRGELGMPSRPEKRYKNEWRGWHEFLHIPKKPELLKKKKSEIKRSFSFKNPSSRRQRVLSVKSERTQKMIKNDLNLILDYKSAILYIKSVNEGLETKVLSALEYRDWARGVTPLGEFPSCLHSQPQNFYKNFSWNTYLGTDLLHNKHREFAAYEECKKWTNDNNIKSVYAYNIYPDRPVNMPQNPRDFYSKRGEWESHGKFFNVPEINYLSYEEHRNFVSDINSKYDGVISSCKNYRNWVEGRLLNIVKFPEFLYTKPDRQFKELGFSWNEFLGEYFKGFIKRNFVTFPEFLEFLKESGIKQSIQYPHSSKLPINIPSYGSLPRLYKGQWKGFKYHRENGDI